MNPSVKKSPSHDREAPVLRAGYAMVGILITLLLAATSAAFAQAPTVNYSGDDDYDPAAGAILPPLTAAVPSMNYSGDDDYDPAAGAILDSPATTAASVGHSDDD